MSPKLNSRCSGVCPPVTLRPQGKTPYSTALPASPSLHTFTPHRASAMNPSALCFPSQPLFCCMLTPIQLLKWLDPSNPGFFAGMPACLPLLHSLLLENASFSRNTVGNSTGDTSLDDSKWCKVQDWWGVGGVCMKSPHAQGKPTAGTLGLSWHHGTKFNNLGFLKEVLNFSLHLISKACSGCLILGQTISFEGQARDKARDSLISQPNYNI